MLRRDFIALLLSFLLDLFGWIKPELKSSEPPITTGGYKFKLGKSALRIRPGESFEAKIHWPVDEVSKSVPIKVFVSGVTGDLGNLLWSDLE